MFKAGDRVRCKDASLAKSYLTEGKEYIVESEQQRIKLKGISAGWYPSRFELVKKATSFDTSTATDQELADEYRRTTEQAYKLVYTLLKRGYEIFDREGTLVNFSSGPVRRISKTMVTEL